jgi:hypothetical protein
MVRTRVVYQGCGMYVGFCGRLDLLNSSALMAIMVNMTSIVVAMLPAVAVVAFVLVAGRPVGCVGVQVGVVEGSPVGGPVGGSDGDSVGCPVGGEEGGARCRRGGNT